MKNRNIINECVRLVMWPISIIFVIFLVCYLCDSLNVTSLLPGKYNFFRNLDVDNWINGIIAMVGSLVSSFFVLFIAIYQLIKQDADYNIDKRLQNKPTILYTVLEKAYDEAPQVYTEEEMDGKNRYELGMTLENIGLNHLKNLKIAISDDSGVLITFPENNSQFIIKKDEKRNINFFLFYNYSKDNKTINDKNILFKVSYDDMLNNHYEQDYYVVISITNIRDSDGKSGCYFYIKDNYALPEEFISKD